MALAANLALRRYGLLVFQTRCRRRLTPRGATLFHSPARRHTVRAVEPGKRRSDRRFPRRFSAHRNQSARVQDAVPAGEAARRTLSSLTTIP